MQTQFGHVQFNVQAAHLAFYEQLFSFLGWHQLAEEEGMLGFGDVNHASVWFIGQVKDVQNDYDGPGLNHVAIHAQAQADIDATVEYLAQHDVQPLFDTPRHRAEFSGEGTTYYQVMFESPDRILFEVVYMGPPAA